MSSEIPEEVDKDEDETLPDGEAAPRRLTDSEFTEIKEIYELGKAGLTDLAAEYGISRQALSKRFKSAGVVKGSRAHELAAAAKTAATAGTAASTAATVEKFADRRSQWIEEVRVQGVQALKQAQLIARKLVADQMKLAPGNLAAIDDNLKTVQRFNKILVDNIQAQVDLLQANSQIDETMLPTLKIEDLTEQDILEHHKNIGALPDDATIEDIQIGDLGEGSAG